MNINSKQVQWKSLLKHSKTVSKLDPKMALIIKMYAQSLLNEKEINENNDIYTTISKEINDDKKKLKIKENLQIYQIYPFENFSVILSKLFTSVLKEDKEGKITFSTAAVYRLTSDLINVINVWKPLEVEEEWLKIKRYCMFKAISIFQKLKYGKDEPVSRKGKSKQDDDLNKELNKLLVQVEHEKKEEELAQQQNTLKRSVTNVEKEYINEVTDKDESMKGKKDDININYHNFENQRKEEVQTPIDSRPRAHTNIAYNLYSKINTNIPPYDNINPQQNFNTNIPPYGNINPQQNFNTNIPPYRNVNPQQNFNKNIPPYGYVNPPYGNVNPQQNFNTNIPPYGNINQQRNINLNASTNIDFTDINKMPHKIIIIDNTNQQTRNPPNTNIQPINIGGINNYRIAPDNMARPNMYSSFIQNVSHQPSNFHIIPNNVNQNPPLNINCNLTPNRVITTNKPTINPNVNMQRVITPNVAKVNKKDEEDEDYLKLVKVISDLKSNKIPTDLIAPKTPTTSNKKESPPKSKSDVVNINSYSPPKDESKNLPNQKTSSSEKSHPVNINQIKPENLSVHTNGNNTKKKQENIFKALTSPLIKENFTLNKNEDTVNLKTPIKYRSIDYYKLVDGIKKTVKIAMKDVDNNKLDKSLAQMENLLFYMTKIEH